VKDDGAAHLPGEEVVMASDRPCQGIYTPCGAAMGTALGGHWERSAANTVGDKRVPRVSTQGISNKPKNES
jgi:hypothetical protein